MKPESASPPPPARAPGAAVVRWGRALGLGIGVWLLGLLLFPPAYTPWAAPTAVPAANADGLPDFALGRVPALLSQLAHPLGGDPAAAPLPNALRWRLLPPAVGHVLGLSPAAYFTGALLAAAALLVVVAYFLLAAGLSPAAAAAATGLVATSSAFFVATGWVGQFDALYLTGLVVFVFARGRVAPAVACALAPWCDERFLLILPACAMLRYQRIGRLDWLPWALGALAPYVLARLIALGLGDGTVARQWAIQQQALADYWPRIGLGWWMGFRAAWPLVLAGLLWPLAGPARRHGLHAAAVGAGLVAVAVLAWDLSRSVAILLPYLMHGAIVLAGWAPRRAPALLAALVAINLLLPATHVVGPVQAPITARLPALLGMPGAR